MKDEKSVLVKFLLILTSLQYTAVDINETPKLFFLCMLRNMIIREGMLNVQACWPVKSQCGLSLTSAVVCFTCTNDIQFCFYNG